MEIKEGMLCWFKGEAPNAGRIGRTIKFVGCLSHPDLPYIKYKDVWEMDSLFVWFKGPAPVGEYPYASAQYLVPILDFPEEELLGDEVIESEKVANGM